MSSRVSIKMIQSHATVDVDGLFSPRLLCKVINRDALNCLGKQSLPVCVIYATRHFGDLWCQLSHDYTKP